VKNAELDEKTIGKETCPRIVIIRWSTSYSDAPGNSGKPMNSSATMQPKDHMSIAVVYLLSVKVQACHLKMNQRPCLNGSISLKKYISIEQKSPTSLK
jgi:hypothetical protein